MSVHEAKKLVVAISSRSANCTGAPVPYAVSFLTTLAASADRFSVFPGSRSSGLVGPGHARTAFDGDCHIAGHHNRNAARNMGLALGKGVTPDAVCV